MSNTTASQILAILPVDMQNDDDYISTVVPILAAIIDRHNHSINDFIDDDYKDENGEPDDDRQTIIDAIEKALSESWGVSDAVKSGVELAKGRPMTKREIALYAVNQNIEFVRGWCADEWTYIGVCVSMLDDDGEPTGEHDAALWGIESISGDYIIDSVVPELIAEIECSINSRTFPVV